MIVELFLMERLETYLGDVVDPWDVGFDAVLLREQHEPITEAYSVTAVCTWHSELAGHGTRWAAHHHAGRIQFLMSEAGAVHLDTPIEMDCVCDRHRVLALLFIVDGHHRYFAHRHMGRKTIKVAFAGRCDVADYLSGRSDTRPEEY